MTREGATPLPAIWWTKPETIDNALQYYTILVVRVVFFICFVQFEIIQKIIANRVFSNIPQYYYCVAIGIHYFSF